MASHYLPDIESDMSVFHRIDDVRAMPAQRFIDLVLRLPAYRGIMRSIVEQAAMDEEGLDMPHADQAPRHHGGEARHVPSDNLDTLAADPAFAGEIEIVRG